jgi:hypothetical protein
VYERVIAVRGENTSVVSSDIVAEGRLAIEAQPTTTN